VDNRGELRHFADYLPVMRTRKPLPLEQLPAMGTLQKNSNLRILHSDYMSVK